MNKLKEINGKFYQEAEVVMLATDKKATDKPFTVGITLCNDCKLKVGNPVGKSESRQELYFLSNEEIKDGDYFYNDLFNMVDKLIKEGLVTDDLIQTLNQNKHNRKIIATTDSFLTIKKGWSGIPWEEHLSQPSQSFIQAYIKAYNEDKTITKVLVEMEETGVIINKKFPTSIRPRFELKVNSSNEIIIKKVKDSWTREEVIEFAERAYQFGRLNPTLSIPKFNQFIEENL